MSYLADLHREVANRTSGRHGAAAKAHVPLTEQIASLTATLPSAVLHRPWSLEELIPRLEGKYRPRPATRSVAQALRRLGWQERRCWKKTGLNRRLWVPPAQL